MVRDIATRFRVRRGYWFAPKMFGIGAAPATWQGWAVTAAFIAAILAVTRLVPPGGARIAVCLALVVAFGILAIRKTDGALGWRWGAR